MRWYQVSMGAIRNFTNKRMNSNPLNKHKTVGKIIFKIIIFLAIVGMVCLVCNMVNAPKNGRKPIGSEKNQTFVVTIKSIPSGARVTFDTTDYKEYETPFTLKGKPGDEYKIKLQKAGYHDTVFTVYISQNTTLEIPLQEIKSADQERIQPQKGWLSVIVKPKNNGCELTIWKNREKIKTITDTSKFKNIELPVGQCSLIVKHPEYGFWHESLEVRRGDTLSIERDFTKKVRFGAELSYKKCSECEAKFDSPPFFVIDDKPTSEKRLYSEIIKIPVGRRKVELKSDNPGFFFESPDSIIDVTEDMEGRVITFIVRRKY